METPVASWIGKSRIDSVIPYLGKNDRVMSSVVLFVNKHSFCIRYSGRCATTPKKYICFSFSMKSQM